MIYIIASFLAARSQSSGSCRTECGRKARIQGSKQSVSIVTTGAAYGVNLAIDMGPISRPKGVTRCVQRLFKSFATAAGSAGHFSSAIQNVLPVIVPPAQHVLTAAAARVSMGYDTESRANNSWHKLPWNTDGQPHSKEHGTQEQRLFYPENGKCGSEEESARRKGSGLLWWPFTVRWRVRGYAGSLYPPSLGELATISIPYRKLGRGGYDLNTVRTQF